MTRRPITRTRVALWFLDGFVVLVVASWLAAWLAPADVAVPLSMGAMIAAAVCMLPVIFL